MPNFTCEVNIQVNVIINMNVVTCGFASSHNQEWMVLEHRNFNSERLGSVGPIFIPSLKVTFLHHDFFNDGQYCIYANSSAAVDEINQMSICIACFSFLFYHKQAYLVRISKLLAGFQGKKKGKKSS